MKNLKIRSLAGLCFALLVIFNISLIVIAVIKSDDLYVAYAILLSCTLFYLFEKFKLSRIFFEYNMDSTSESVNSSSEDKHHPDYYEINLN